MKITDFEKVIRDQVQIESENDKNWEWNVSSIDDEKVCIHWGYFDYLNEPKHIVIRIDDLCVEGDEEYMLVGYISSSYSEFNVLVGKNFWDDCEDLKEGFSMVVHGVVALAKDLYQKYPERDIFY